MNNVLLVIHLLVAVAMIGVVLLQRSEGGGLGMGGGGGGGGMGGFLTGRGTASLLTRATAFLATAFMVTSLTLSIFASGPPEPRSIIDELPATPPPPQEPVGPSVPVQ